MGRRSAEMAGHVRRLAAPVSIATIERPNVELHPRHDWEGAGIMPLREPPGPEISHMKNNGG